MGQNLTGQSIASTYEDLVQISGSILTNGLGTDITSLTVTASFASQAGTSGYAGTAGTAAFATSASFATTASFALNATPTNTGSLMVTGSALSNVLTFTKGDGSQFSLTVATGSAVTVNTGSLLTTASFSDPNLTFTKGDGSTFAVGLTTLVPLTSSYALQAGTAGFALQAGTAGFATQAGTSGFATSASFASQAGTAGFASTSTSASFASQAGTAGFAISASFAATASYVNLGTSATASFTGTTWTFNHNLNQTFVIVDCYDSNGEEIIPQTVDLVSANQAVITFPVSVSGTAVASLGNGIVQNSVTNNNIFNASPINTLSSQVGSFQTNFTQKLTVTTATTHNLHVSASGPHWVDFTGLASGTTANLNIYMYIDSFAGFAANSGSTIMFTAGAGTGNFVTYRTIATGSGGWVSTGTSVGASSTSVLRNATLTTRTVNNAAVNPTVIVKTTDGDVVLYNPASPSFNPSYAFTGSQGTPIP